MKKLLIQLVIYALSSHSAFANHNVSSKASVTYLKEVKIDLNITKFSNPVEVTWGKVTKDVDNVSGRWSELIEVSWFPVTRNKISYEKWVSFFDVKSFPREGFGRFMYDKTKEKFPTAEAFKASKVNKFRANQVVFAEVAVGQSGLVLLAQSKKDYMKSPCKLNVLGLLFSVDEKGEILHSYKKPVVLGDAIFPFTDLEFLEGWITKGFAIRGEGGKLQLLKLEPGSLLRKKSSNR